MNIGFAWPSVELQMTLLNGSWIILKFLNKMCGFCKHYFASTALFFYFVVVLFISTPKILANRRRRAFGEFITIIFISMSPFSALQVHHITAGVQCAKSEGFL